MSPTADPTTTRSPATAGGGSDLILALPELLSDAGIEIHLPGVAEVRAARTGPGIEGEQARVVGGGENTAPAGISGGAIRIEPGCHTAADELIRVVTAEIEAGIEFPALRSRFGIEGEDPVEGSAGEESAVHQERSELECTLVSSNFPLPSAMSPVRWVKAISS